jgi:hypothetical protein
VIASIGHAIWVGVAIAALGVSAVAAGVLAYALIQLAVMAKVTALLVDGIRQETVPLLSEVTTTVSSLNKEMDRVDGMLESAGHIVKSAERVTSVVEQTVSSPLIKVAAFGAGATRAFRRLSKKKG